MLFMLTILLSVCWWFLHIAIINNAPGLRLKLLNILFERNYLATPIEFIIIIFLVLLNHLLKILHCFVVLLGRRYYICVWDLLSIKRRGLHMLFRALLGCLCTWTSCLILLVTSIGFLGSFILLLLLEVLLELF
jgi:hypothetical protein